MRFLNIFIISFLFVNKIFAQSSQDWNAANQAYDSSDYERAIVLYSKIIEQQPLNTQVLYNLGNSNYKLNNIADAVWYYEKVLTIDPNHKDASINKTIAKQRIPNAIKSNDPIFFVKWWNIMTHPTNSNTLAYFAMFVSMLTVVLIVLKNKIRVPIQLTIMLALVTIAALTIAVISANNQLLNKKGIIFGSQTQLLSSPDVLKNAFNIPEATEANIIDTKGDWCFVELPDSRTGWVRINQIRTLQTIAP
jgi:tetratricopeptide (TPR) repeat protein